MSITLEVMAGLDCKGAIIGVAFGPVVEKRVTAPSAVSATVGPYPDVRFSLEVLAKLS
jgi:hypothetical protein